ncbi:sugar ABC transporter permease [Homoserinibacter sp. GY 40078]|nr:sugar ABC transporter permease [Homoserinibacter sp. GY 40078]
MIERREALPEVLTPPPARRGMTRERRAQVRGLLFVSPWIVGLLAFVVFPIVYSVYISLTDYYGIGTPKFVGLKNFETLFSDPIALLAGLNTIGYAGAAVPLTLLVALLLAFAMNRKVREVAIYRTALYLPTLIPLFALAFVVIVLINPSTGPISSLLGAVGLGNRDLLSDPNLARWVIIAMAPLTAGNAAIIFLAGLNNIPGSLYEAARLDGANAIQQFMHVTLPLLSPAILFNLIVGISAGLEVFTQGYVMTGGGPNNATLYYLLFIYQNAFSYNRFGYASAAALVLFLVGLVLAAIVYQISKRFVNYDAAA